MIIKTTNIYKLKKDFDYMSNQSLVKHRYKNRNLNLEQILERIELVDDIKILNENDDQMTYCPFYVLPTASIQSEVCGLFTVKSDVVDVPVDFMREDLFTTWFYEIIPEGLFLCEESETKVHLPLYKVENLYVDKETDELISLDLGNEDVEDPLFNVYGLKIDKMVNPVLLLSETNQGLKTVLVVSNDEENFDIYPYQMEMTSKLNLVAKSCYDSKAALEMKKELCQEVANMLRQNEEANREEAVSEEFDKEFDWHSPKKIVEYLDEYIIGQNEAKRGVAVAFSNYMTRFSKDDENLPKENILLLGPSGVGKTYMISLLAKKAGLPLAQTKITGKSVEGYKGENLSSVFNYISSETGGDEVPYGIVFFDEIDKVVKSDNIGFGNSIQDELIGWLEEAIIQCKSDSNKYKTQISTKNLLFVFAGAFYGEGRSLYEIVEERLYGKRNQIGFDKDTENKKQKRENPELMQQVTQSDIIKYGIKPELVGRIPSVNVLNPLSLDEKITILSSAKNSSLSQYIDLLSAKGFEVRVEPDSYAEIVRHSDARTGARSLSSVCNKVFTKIMYDPEFYLKDGVITITPELIRDNVVARMN